MILVAIPASFVNSYLDFLNKRLSIHFRKRLTFHFHEKYLKDMIFYQVQLNFTKISSEISIAESQTQIKD